MKANEFDKKIKGQVKKVEHIAPTHVTWDINKSWDKISQLLKQASPKSMVWYLSLAASVSMVMANVSLMDYRWENQAPKPSIQPKLTNLNTVVLPTVQQVEKQPSHAQSDLYMMVIPKKVSAIPTITLAQTQADVIPLAGYSSALQDSPPRVSFKPLLTTSIATSGARFSGELMVITSHRIKNASLGMSLEMSSQINGIGREAPASNQSRQTLYMNMVVLNDQARRPWTARIGTPLWQTNAGDSTVPMIKMNYQTKVGKRIYIGPEVIFTKAFKQVYPGISLSFG